MHEQQNQYWPGPGNLLQASGKYATSASAMPAAVVTTACNLNAVCTVIALVLH